MRNLFRYIKNFFFCLKYPFWRSRNVWTGELGGYFDDGEIYLNGATAFVMNDNNVSIQNIFVERNQFHINGSNKYD